MIFPDILFLETFFSDLTPVELTVKAAEYLFQHLLYYLYLKAAEYLLQHLTFDLLFDHLENVNKNHFENLHL